MSPVDIMRQSVWAQGAAAEMAAQAAAPEEAAAGTEAAAVPVAADSRHAAAAEPPADAREKGEDAGMDGKVRMSATAQASKQGTSHKLLSLLCTRKCCVPCCCFDSIALQPCLKSPGPLQELSMAAEGKGKAGGAASADDDLDELLANINSSEPARSKKSKPVRCVHAGRHCWAWCPSTNQSPVLQGAASQGAAPPLAEAATSPEHAAAPLAATGGEAAEAEAADAREEDGDAAADNKARMTAPPVLNEWLSSVVSLYRHHCVWARSQCP